jgi:uncharacterized protein (UPF0335 family)
MTSPNVTPAELAAFVERIEAINADISEHTAARKDVYAELKSRGYDPKATRKIIALRKKRPDERAEDDAVETLYRQALGV